MVNKGGIYREIRYFGEIFWNLIKLDDELVLEIRKNGGFRKIIKDKPQNKKSVYLD